MAPSTPLEPPSFCLSISVLWFYGFNIDCPNGYCPSGYDGIEMHETGLFTNGTGPSHGLFFWESSGASNSFVQNGIFINGESVGVKTGNKTYTCRKQTTCLFYEYMITSTSCSAYCGTFFAIPSGWKNTDEIWYQLSDFSKNSDMSFSFDDQTTF
ncbi:MAG: hypothetical protein OK439_00145 [Thaumarchaeota archaeon]|nr:hypothetical protein [Nitrososphaerota archaeon]